MLIAGVIAICIVLAILGFLVPRLSDHGADKGFSTGARAGSKAPGPIGRLLANSFGTSQRAADKSHSAGKKGPLEVPVLTLDNDQNKPRSSS